MERMLMAALFATCISLAFLINLGWGKVVVKVDGDATCNCKEPDNIVNRYSINIIPKEDCPACACNESKTLEKQIMGGLDYDLEFVRLDLHNGNYTAILKIKNSDGETVDELLVPRIEDENGSSIPKSFNLTTDEGDVMYIEVHEIGFPWCFGAQWANVSISQEKTVELNGILSPEESLKHDYAMMVIR